MSFNEHQPPPPPPPPPSYMFGAWSGFPQNHPGFPFNHDDHEFYGQFGPVVGHPDVPSAQKRARQSEDNHLGIPFNSRMNPPAGTGARGGTGHIFYKTRLCVKFSDGNCRNGDSCNFAHGTHDLRHPPPNWQDMVGGGKDLGSGRSDEEHRRNHNTRICKRYYNGEECAYGENCVFLHERPTRDEGRESAAISVGVSGTSVGVSGTSGGHSHSHRSEKPPFYWKSKPGPGGERSHFDHGHGQTGSHGSRSRNEGDTLVVNQSRPSGGGAPFGEPIKRREKEDNAWRWKLNKKINRIYADWLDDLSPPRNVEPDAET